MRHASQPIWDAFARRAIATWPRGARDDLARWMASSGCSTIERRALAVSATEIGARSLA